MMDAYELMNWLPSACWDMAGGDEAEGEAYYENAGVLRDLIGDHLIHQKDCQDVLLEIWEVTDHDKIKVACANLLRDHFEFDPENP